ncbi:MAG: hypothetical protein ABJM58_10665 [Alteripontixanthobacter sp.]
MAYEPNAPTAEERDGIHRLVWLGAFLSLVLVIVVALGVSRHVETWAGLIVGLYIATFSITNRADDYFRALARNGARWAVIVVGLWMAGQTLMGITEGYYGAGFSAGGAAIPADDVTWQIPALANNAFFLASCAALAFHAGFLFQHFRGRE